MYCNLNHTELHANSNFFMMSLSDPPAFFLLNLDISIKMWIIKIKEKLERFDVLTTLVIDKNKKWSFTSLWIEKWTKQTFFDLQLTLTSNGNPFLKYFTILSHLNLYGVSTNITWVLLAPCVFPDDCSVTDTWMWRRCPR